MRPVENQVFDLPAANDETRFAQLTARGRGAIASVVVAGRGANDAVDRFFRPAAGCSVRSLPLQSLVYGEWGHSRDDALAAEDVVLVRTGHHRIEVHCHGGMAAIESISTGLEAVGCRRSSWQEQLGSQVSTITETQLALPYAQTARTAAILLDQLHGATTHAAQRVVDLARSQRIADASELVESVLATVEVGRHLTRPWQVAIAGPANAGKSTLINAILGFDRSIVHHEPGTTRDVLTAATAIDGWPIQLADTAGVRPTTDSIETQGIALARQTTRQADVVLLVLDATQELSNAQQTVISDYPAAIVLRNKCDLVTCPWPPETSALEISALTRKGLPRLQRLVSERLVPDPPRPGEAVISTPRQESIFARMRELLHGGGPAEHLVSRLEMLAGELG